MAWIKRNLFFVIGGILAASLLGAAGFYDFKSWSHNSAAFDKLNEIYGTLKDLSDQKPAPGNDKVNNIDAARDQEREVQKWIEQARNYFQPVAPVPDPTNGIVSSEGFAAALRRTIDQLQHEAENASVVLPPRYSFSFEAQRSLVRFAPGSLEPMAEQLGEVKAISEILFAVRINSLDGLQRVRISDDDVGGPQADYLDDHSVTNELAIVTPYQITFRSFTPEIAKVLAGFASSPHGFIVKAINVQPAGMAPPSNGSEANGQPPTSPSPTLLPPPRGGLQTVLNEQLLRVTLMVEIVKLQPKK